MQAASCFVFNCQIIKEALPRAWGLCVRSANDRKHRSHVPPSRKMEIGSGNLEQCRFFFSSEIVLPEATDRFRKIDVKQVSARQIPMSYCWFATKTFKPRSRFCWSTTQSRRQSTEGSLLKSSEIKSAFSQHRHSLSEISYQIFTDFEGIEASMKARSDSRDILTTFSGLEFGWCLKLFVFFQTYSNRRPDHT